MSWAYLVLAGIFEIVWAFALKQSHGFTRLIPATITIACMIGSFWLLALAMRTLPLGTPTRSGQVWAQLEHSSSALLS